MGKKRVVLDTNIIISGLGFKGVSRVLINKVITHYEWIISEKQLLEIKRVLKYPKFDFEEELISKILLFVSENTTTINANVELKVVKEDPDDDFLLELALDGRANIIISGNKHLLKLKEYKHIKIIDSKTFLS